MKTTKLIGFIVVCVTTCLAVAIQTYRASTPAAIQVFAGVDQVLCQYESLPMLQLQATITGEVQDGDWFAFGDGRFQPGNLITVRHSVIQLGTVTYVPGPGDKALGYYRLMLMSDIPVNNPQERAMDEVRISFQAPPPLLCNSNFTISLNEVCQQAVDVTLLHPNPVPPFQHYQITLIDKQGQPIPGNLLTRQHVNTEVSFRLGHRCTVNFCTGKFLVEDYYPPVFSCRNDTITCLKPTMPDSVGLPIPRRAVVDTIIQGKYYIQNWDYCSDVVLEYKDVVTQASCNKNEDKTIRRKWTATDARGNRAECMQTIVVTRISLNQVVFPENFDGIKHPSFECSDTFPVLPNGHPSPDTTGTPEIGSCGHLFHSMQDVRFELCGKGFKVARTWLVIDWCSGESVTRLQTISVKDTRPPQVVCLDTIRLAADPYACALPKTEAPPLLNAADCSSLQVHYMVSDTGSYQENSYPGAVIEEGGKWFLRNLPVGTYQLHTLATDACGNNTSCATILIVEDRSAPSATCRQFTTLTLDNTGRGRLYAHSLDDGSTDNCGIANFQVRKREGTCYIEPAFSDYVEFCCEEVGEQMAVQLQVTDIHGLTNQCEIQIEVDDKLPPVLTCPPSLTVACTENLNPSALQRFGTVVTDPLLVRPIQLVNAFHQGLVGQDGLATDNCQVSVAETINQDIQCYEGVIRRTFVARDKGGRKDSCVQEIFVRNPEPFSEKDIQWPAHIELDGCRTTDIRPQVVGRPVFIQQACANVAATFEDQSFYSSDGACVKVFRSWTVIDWCQFDANGTTGKFGPFTQVITVLNSDKPVIIEGCRDTTICSFDPECKSALVSLMASATDPCTPEDHLIWDCRIDLYSDGLIDIVTATRTLQRQLPLGRHLVTWRVEDQCGNSEVCSQQIEIHDCKPPTPYCHASLSAVLDPITRGFVLNARDFDLGSYDNCSPSLYYTIGETRPVDSLRLQKHYFTAQGLSDQASFEKSNAFLWLPGQQTAAMRYRCEDLPDGKAAEIPVPVTLWDGEGNRDFCQVTLRLEDHHGLCPDVLTHTSVAGRILTENKKIPVGVEIHYKGNEKEGLVKTQTDGSYLIQELPVNSEYTLTPSFNSNPMEGITTMDLVLIQRHILGITPFSSPFQRIAADVNGSGSISASDLLDLRKLILGINTAFPKGMPSWLFINKANPFQQIDNPFSFNSALEISVKEEAMQQQDFIAVKLGDVNQSALPLANPAWDERNIPSPFLMEAQLVNRAGEQLLEIRSGEEAQIHGFQCFVNRPALLAPHQDTVQKMVDVALSDSYYAINDDRVGFLAFSHDKIQINKGTLLASIPWCDGCGTPSLLSDAFRPSAIYTSDTSRPVNIRLKKEAEPGYTFNIPVNVDSKAPSLEWDVPVQSLDIRLTILDTRAQVLSVLSQQVGNRGSIPLPLPGDIPPGYYFLHILWQSGSKTIPFTVLR